MPTPDLDLPALRAVIAGVRERLAKATPIHDAMFGEGVTAQDFPDGGYLLYSDGEALVAVLPKRPDDAALSDRDFYCHAPSDLTTLAAACERLAEENERLRGDLRDAHSVLVMARAFHAYSGGPLSGPFPSVVERRLSGYRTPAPAGKGEG